MRAEHGDPASVVVHDTRSYLPAVGGRPPARLPSTKLHAARRRVTGWTECLHQREEARVAGLFGRREAGGEPAAFTRSSALRTRPGRGTPPLRPLIATRCLRSDHARARCRSGSSR
jgi:hypothetical protein